MTEQYDDYCETKVNPLASAKKSRFRGFFLQKAFHRTLELNALELSFGCHHWISAPKTVRRPLLKLLALCVGGT